MKFNNTQEQFFELIRAGLFPDKEARILEHGSSVEAAGSGCWLLAVSFWLVAHWTRGCIANG